MSKLIKLDSEIMRLEAKLEDSVPSASMGEREISYLKAKFGYNPNGSSEEKEIARMIDEFKSWVKEKKTVGKGYERI